MSQQPFVGSGTSSTSLVQQQVAVAPINNSLGLALPQVVGNQQQQQQQQQSQYSPQANYYQQLIKSAQQQQQHYIHQTTPTTNTARLNGLTAATNGPLQPSHQLAQYSTSQQNSPSTNHQIDTNGIYNGLASRPAALAPIYAPKPTPIQYPMQYATGGAGQQVNMSQSSQPLYQQRPIQQQHSPAALQQVSAASGLSVRQFSQTNGGFQPATGVMMSMPQQQQQQQQQIEDQRQQQQMQQLIMSYHHQQQQQQHLAQVDPQLAQNLQQSQVEMRWPSQQQHHFDERLNPNPLDHRLLPVHRQRHSQQQPLMHQRAIADDRDSISTLSRFNQFDDRRSFTMRSQYTNANKILKDSRKFSFMKLTGQAVRGILGLDYPAPGGKGDSLQRNLNQHLQHQHDSTSGNTSGKQIPFGSGAKITAIDSGEDYYFKRKVFKYQLIILRVINLICASLVLLSPVAMLLIPKMEFLFRAQQEFDATSADNPTSSALRPASVGITHAVGISQSSLSREHLQANKQQAYFTPQPQWRISDCNSDCDGPLIGFVCRLIMLCAAYWAIFFRPQTATLPRIDFQRCLLTSMALLLTLAYWLFFIFRVFDKRYNDFELQYMTIVQFSLSLLESLILLHYLAVVLLELRQRKKVYCLKVVRSPDGASQYYSCGSLSIQKCAQFVLEKYHRNFKSFNAIAEHQLQLEDQVAVASVNSNNSSGADHRRAADQRSGSPANSHRGDTSGADASNKRHHHNHHSSSGDASRRRSSSRASRHRSRSTRTGEHDTADRSASNSPVSGSRHRSQGGRSTLRRNNNNETSDKQVRTHQLDVDAPAMTNLKQLADNAEVQQPNTEEEAASAAITVAEMSETSNKQQQQQQQDQDSSNSADQSSDATSRMKESSLETIKAANSTADLLSGGNQKTPAASLLSGTKSSAATTIHQQQQQNQSTRDETESVRSVRSRRSTAAPGSRSHHHHHHHHGHSTSNRDTHSSSHHHRERSSSRARLDEQESSTMRRGQHHHSINMPQQQQHQAQPDLLEEHERKLRRRKFRLLGTVQDTFERLKRVDQQNQQTTEADHYNQVAESGAGLNLHQQAKQTLGPHQAARSLYPSIARSLQKYLRLTKQTGRHNLQSIYEHLAKCLLYGLSARTFIEKFTNNDPVWQQSETSLFANCKLVDSTLMYPAHANIDDLEINSWSLMCDTLLSRHIDSGTFFVLQQGQVSLLVTVAKIPHLSLKEEVVDQKSCKFTLEPSSESAV